MGKKIVIVGGVAGGASCAARARRLSEEAEIIMFESGEFVSFANCGLPYYVGNVIPKEEHLIVASAQLFKDRFNIDVRTQSRVTAIDSKNQKVSVTDLKSGLPYEESYDALMLAPGSVPFCPPGSYIDGFFTVKTIPEARGVINEIKNKDAKSAIIAGGGFIGLEMAENLHKLGLSVTIAEMQHHVMPALDPEMGALINDHLEKNGIKLCLGQKISKFESLENDRIGIELESGEKLSADIGILSLGVRPKSELAKDAGLKIGSRGGIVVDNTMRTSDPNIWAAGDAVEVKDFLTKANTMVPLAGPANRQGRLAAESILGKAKRVFRGVQGTAVCGIMGMTVASTGLSEKILKQRQDIDYEKIYIHPPSHATYYPGAKTITIKLIFSKEDGKVLGSQAIGTDGVEKRIDVIAAMIQKNGTVFDLEEAELCYAPQYGSAKDPVNMAGMTAANILDGYCKIKHWENFSIKDDFLIDIRDPFEFAKEHIEGAVNIPLKDLRSKIDRLPRDRAIHLYCVVGQRSYFAYRILAQYGFNVKTMSGGLNIYRAIELLKKYGYR